MPPIHFQLIPPMKNRTRKIMAKVAVVERSGSRKIMTAGMANSSSARKTVDGLLIFSRKYPKNQAKNRIRQTFANSEGWKLPRPGTRSHLVAP